MLQVTKRPSLQMLKKGEQIPRLVVSEIVQQAFGHEGDFRAVDAFDLMRMKHDFGAAGESKANTSFYSRERRVRTRSFGPKLILARRNS